MGLLRLPDFIGILAMTLDHNQFVLSLNMNQPYMYSHCEPDEGGRGNLNLHSETTLVATWSRARRRRAC